MKEAIDNLTHNYDGLEATMRKAANQDTNIDIPGIVRDPTPVASVPNVGGDEGICTMI
jgi:hypothetical protein